MARRMKAPKTQSKRAGSEDVFNAKVAEAQRQHQPVISVDTKKKELVGNYKNGGKTNYRPERRSMSGERARL